MHQLKHIILIYMIIIWCIRQRQKRHLTVVFLLSIFCLFVFVAIFVVCCFFFCLLLFFLGGGGGVVVWGLLNSISISDGHDGSFILID